MKAGDKVTLQKEIPTPEAWTGPINSYYYENKENGKRIHEEVYTAMIKRRNHLAEFIEEIDPVDDSDL